MEIQLSDHFTYRKLLRFTIPSIVMMIFTSIYGVVDGIFVSNFAGKTPFAAVNLIMPFLMICGAVGFMIGTGGTALVSMRLGEGKREEANRIFSLLIYFVIGIGFVLTILGELSLRRISVLLGADGDMLTYCVQYGRIILLALIPFMLQNVFQSFMVTAEKPNLGLAVTVISGVTNIALDALFVAGFRWGVQGAAAATALSQCAGGLIPLAYFIFPNSSTLRIGKTKWNGRALLKACTNGSSEFMTNISMSVVNMCYNFQLMKLAGEDGIAAYGVIMYVNFIFVSVFIGYSIGSAPIVGYHYGAGNHEELHSLLKRSLVIIGTCGVLLTVLAELTAVPLSAIFTSYDEELLAMTVRGFRIYSVSFLVNGINIYASAFFTALSNGAVSATISFLRTLLFQIAAVMLLPLILELDGIWGSIIVAEVLALFVSLFFWIKMRPKYQY